MLSNMPTTSTMLPDGAAPAVRLRLLHVPGLCDYLDASTASLAMPTSSCGLGTCASSPAWLTTALPAMLHHSLATGLVWSVISPPCLPPILSLACSCRRRLPVMTTPRTGSLSSLASVSSSPPSSLPSLPLWHGSSQTVLTFLRAMKHVLCLMAIPSLAPFMMVMATSRTVWQSRPRPPLVLIRSSMLMPSSAGTNATSSCMVCSSKRCLRGSRRQSTTATATMALLPWSFSVLSLTQCPRATTPLSLRLCSALSSTLVLTSVTQTFALSTTTS